MSIDARNEAVRLWEEYLRLENTISSESTDSDFRKRDEAFAAYEDHGLSLALDEEGNVYRSGGVPLLDDELGSLGDARPEMVGISG